MRVETEEETAIIIPSESIDLSNADLLRDRFDKLVDADFKEIVLDFSQVETIDSSGIGKLLLFTKIMKEQEGKMKIVNVQSPYVKKVFSMVNLADVIDISEVDWFLTFLDSTYFKKDSALLITIIKYWIC